MKHLFTKLLLVLAVVFGVSVAQATDFYLVGYANAMEETDKTVGYNPPGATLTTDANGDVYFWVNGTFQLSTVGSSHWDEQDGVPGYNSGLLKFTNGSVVPEGGDSNLGSGKKLYVKLTYTGSDSDSDKKNGANYSYSVQDTPFGTTPPTPPTPVSYFENGSTIYFQPSPNFRVHGSSGDATFKAVFNDNTEVFCTKRGDSGYWYFSVPKDGLYSVKIQRGNSSNTSTGGGWYDNYTQEMSCEEGMDLICMENDPGNDWTAVTCIWKVYDGPESVYTYSVYNNFENGSEWKDLVFTETDGVLNAKIDLGSGLELHRGCIIRVYKDGVLVGRYSASAGDNVLSLLNKDVILNLNETSSDTQNIQIPAGTTACSFTLTLDEKKPVTLRVVLEGDRTPDLWIGPGSNENDRTQIGITSGEYDVYELDAQAGETFRFYSAASGGKWIGPVEDTTKVIPGNGETEHTTAGNGAVYSFQTAGHYIIRVLSYDGDCTVVFKVMRQEDYQGEVPENLTLLLWNNTQAELSPVKSVKMTYDPATSRFSGTIPGEFYGGDHWLTMRLLSTDASGKALATFGTNGSDIYNNDNDRTRNLSVYTGNTILGNTKINYYDGNATFDNWEGDMTVIADFSGAVPTVSVYPCYYFIGDQNKWFSKEFDGDPNRGINVEERDKNKPGYEFMPELDENGKWTGWFIYRTPRLAGQFQIFNGIKWDTRIENSGHTYSHKVDIQNNPDKFREYLSNPMIIGGESNTVRKSMGQNFNLPCNAVEDCEIRFRPDVSNPELQIVGKMVDYYIFYGRNGDADRKTPLRAHINSEKPNKNNYYLPFNEITSIDDHGVETTQFKGDNVKVGDAVDYDHMNYTEGDNWDANGKKMVLLEFDENGKYKEGDAAFYALFPYADDVKEAYNNGTLPNGMSLAGRSIWYAKVPNGFANPAGTHFAVAFRNSEDPASYRDTAMEYPLWTPLGLRHLYFFDGIHMHVSNSSWDDLCDAEISYRIYTYDINYNNVVVDYLNVPDASTGNLYTLYVKAAAGTRAEATTDEDEDGWIKLSDNHNNCGMWTSVDDECGCPLVNGSVMHDWRVVDDEPETEGSIVRNEIPAGLASARVQFRIKIYPKGALKTRANARNFEPYTVYFPAAPTIAQSDDEIRLQGVDHYQVMDNGNGVWTGINDILDDMTFDVENGESNVSDAAPVYYNLQGVRVEKPGKGLHIVVRGNKSEKVLF